MAFSCSSYLPCPVCGYWLNIQKERGSLKRRGTCDINGIFLEDFFVCLWNVFCNVRHKYLVCLNQYNVDTQKNVVLRYNVPRLQTGSGIPNICIKTCHQKITNPSCKHFNVLPMSWGRQGDEAHGEANLGYKFLSGKKVPVSCKYEHF